MKDIILEEGEMICDECNGKGETLDYEWGGCYCMASLEGGYCQCSPPDIECPKCHGEGKIKISDQ